LASIGLCSTTYHPVQLHVSSSRGDARADAGHGSVASKLRFHHSRRDRRMAGDFRPLRPLSSAHSVLALMGYSTLTSIVASNLTIDFPIYGSSHRSLRQTLFARTGGLVRHEHAGRQKRIVVRALDEISFTLRNGDRLGLIGHNGAGKSTLLKVIAGGYTPDAGSIRIEGRVSPLFNSAPGLDAGANRYDNIKTCGMLLGMSSDEIDRKLLDIVDFCELGEYLDLPVRTYSTGMVARLGFAIATAIEPDILLLDEGLGAGDARFAARAEARMQS